MLIKTVPNKPPALLLGLHIRTIAAHNAVAKTHNRWLIHKTQGSIPKTYCAAKEPANAQTETANSSQTAFLNNGVIFSTHQSKYRYADFAGYIPRWQGTNRHRRRCGRFRFSPICTKPDKGQNGDLPTQCPQKIHPEDLNFGKLSESKASADKEKSKVYFNESI